MVFEAPALGGIPLLEITSAKRGRKSLWYAVFYLSLQSILTLLPKGVFCIVVLRLLPSFFSLYPLCHTPRFNQKLTKNRYKYNVTIWISIHISLPKREQSHTQVRIPEGREAHTAQHSSYNSKKRNRPEAKHRQYIQERTYLRSKEEETGEPWWKAKGHSRADQRMREGDRRETSHLLHDGNGRRTEGDGDGRETTA